MAENSGISWTDHTFNPWMGCTKVSPACKHCYAERDMDHRFGKVAWGPNGTRVKTSDQNWKKPFQWNDMAASHNVRARVFCASLADVFEEWDGPIHDHRGLVGAVLNDGDWAWVRPKEDGTLGDVTNARPMTMDDLRERLFMLIDATPHLDWLLLTKRPENIKKHWTNVTPRYQFFRGYPSSGGPFERRQNVWLGTSVENQEWADKRITVLEECRDLSPVLFLSCEPLLGPVDLDFACVQKELSCIDWVIAGGESGQESRPSHPDWFRSLRDQCDAADVPFHLKQWGEWYPLHGTGVASSDEDDEVSPFCWIDRQGKTTDSGCEPDKIMVRVGTKKAGRTLDGIVHDAFPEGVR